MLTKRFFFFWNIQILSHSHSLHTHRVGRHHVKSYRKNVFSITFCSYNISTKQSVCDVKWFSAFSVAVVVVILFFFFAFAVCPRHNQTLTHSQFLAPIFGVESEMNVQKSTFHIKHILHIMAIQYYLMIFDDVHVIRRRPKVSFDWIFRIFRWWWWWWCWWCCCCYWVCIDCHPMRMTNTNSMQCHKNTRNAFRIL